MGRPETSSNANVGPMLAKFQAMASGVEPPPRIAQKMGFRIVDVQHGCATVSFLATRDFANPLGSLHGGVLCDLCDLAMGMSFGSTLAATQSFTTLEMKINFLKPIWESELIAKGRVVKRGRTIGLAECDVFAGDTLVARASSTCMVLATSNAAQPLRRDRVTDASGAT